MVKYKQLTEQNKKDIIEHFKKDVNNTAKDIALLLDLPRFQVNGVINKYLLSINIRKY